jgi:putative Holliday junction resolvase
MSSNNKLSGDLIGLDLGMVRTGVARINTVARIAEPLDIISMDVSNLASEVTRFVNKYSACAVVCGLPRGLDGQETDQTRWAAEQITELQKALNVAVYAIDEAGTTKQAEIKASKNQSVDSVAAGILLEDFLDEVARGKIVNASI